MSRYCPLVIRIETIHIESHRIVEVIVLVVPCQRDLTQSGIAHEACCQATSYLQIDVEAGLVVRTFKELVIFRALHIDAVHTVAHRLACNGLIDGIDGSLFVP